MKAGFARQKITPNLEDKIELSGYGYFLDRVADRILDDLYASSLIIEGNNKRKAVLMSVDVVGLDNATVKMIKAGVADNTDITENNMLIAATHTHSGPSTIDFLACGRHHQGYVDNVLVPGAIQSAIDAQKDIKHGWVGFNRKNIKDISYNRTVGYLLDNSLDLMIIERENTHIYALNFPCHPVVLSGDSRKVSRDYPGVVVDRLLSDVNGLDGVLWLTGCCGDINPNCIKERGSGKKDLEKEIEDTREIGSKLAKEAREVAKMELTGSYNLYTARREIEFSYDVEFVFNAEQEIENIKKKYANPEKKFMKGFTQFVKEAERRMTQKNMPIGRVGEVIGVRIGDYKIIGLPGEIYSLTGQKIKQDNEKIIIASCTNGVIGYIPPKEEYDKLGNYATGRGQLIYNSRPFAKDSEERLVNAARNLLEELDRAE